MVVGEFTEQADLLVIGGGPGGYSAAIRASQLGRSVTLVERENIGGVCLNVGCIPSKALIELSSRFHELDSLSKKGVVTEDAHIDPIVLSQTVTGSVERLTSGVRQLLKAAEVEIVEGEASFVGPNEVRIRASHETSRIKFKDCILATGSSPRELDGFTVDHQRVLDSTDLLFTPVIRRDLIIIGGGYIGVELGSAHARLGTKVTILEMAPEIVMGVEPEIQRTLRTVLREMGVEVRTGVEVHGMKTVGDSVVVEITNGELTEEIRGNAVAVLVGRVPNLDDDLGLAMAGITIGSDYRVEVDDQMRTSNAHVFAIGDIVPGPMLAHKAYYEAKVAAEVAGGQQAGNDATVIPAVIFAEPEVAVAGLGEQEARSRYPDNVLVAKFPYRANGRAIVLGASVGEVKLIALADSRRLLGVHIVGIDASNLISEAVLAIELGATIDDLALTIHPHPTLSEMYPEAAEVAQGLPTHIIVQQQRSK
ncbi:dihydrolipoyl dehydrogenase [Ferrimicrobium acidiphilum]|uniref:dihydrolipoyl dehydrogenase n=1 Tax=Ferrimicrobium acidiphilum TaxID=121039 RepID=UPI0023F34C9F|nr:dihydrolipoyl dehydrogenase [Ferrimicrobium acidiphilum]